MNKMLDIFFHDRFLHIYVEKLESPLSVQLYKIIFMWANPGIGGHFRKLKISDFFKIGDDYNCIFGIKLKGLSLSFF